MARIVAIVDSTEVPDMSDVTFKEGKKSFVTRLTKLIADSLKIGQKISLNGIEKLEQPVTMVSMGAKTLHSLDSNTTSRVHVKQGPNGIACPKCGTELTDGPPHTCRISRDGPTIQTLCPMCGFSKQRLI